MAMRLEAPATKKAAGVPRPAACYLSKIPHPWESRLCCFTLTLKPHDTAFMVIDP